jgi:hypothetical protein
MSTRTQVQMEWGTALEIASFAGVAREPVWDTTNQRIVIMLGTGAGNKVAMASEPYVDAKVALAGGGGSSPFANWLYST